MGGVGSRASRRPTLAGAAWIAVPLALTAVPGPDLISMVGVLLALGAAMFAGPGSALGATAALLPLVFITTQVRGTSWSLLELGLLCTGAACAGEIARRLLTRSTRQLVGQLFRPLDLTIVAGALALVGLLSLLWVADDRALANSQRELRRVILEPLIVVVAARLSPIQATRTVVARCLVVSGIIVSAIAVGQVALRSSGVEVGAVFRPIGTFPHPNNLALYLERIVWLPLAVVGGREGSRLGVGLTAMVAIACAATLSRGAVIALVVGGITWLLLSRRAVHRLLLAGGVASATALVLLGRLGGDGTESLGSRRKIWDGAVAMLRDEPVTGVGIDQFYQLYGTRYIDPAGWVERYASHPHNIILDFWLQLGVAGLAILVGIGWLVTRRALAVRASATSPIQAALLAGLIAGFAHGLIDNGFFLPDLATYLWLALALTAVSSPLLEAG